ncbi:MAG: hypothetical protein PHC88_03510 [Terrimicrobiaceae bacterium]|nr:hypothetical protein [Terrimicrobiaceae bacterium]
MTACRVAAAAFLLAGCAIAPRAAFQPTASRHAIVTWRNGANLLVADMDFQTGANGALRLLVAKDAPLLALTRAGGEWTAVGPLARNGWRGAWNTAPAPLAGWLCLAEAYEGASAAPDGDSDVRTGRFSVRYAKHGADLQVFELLDVATGGRFRVHFQRDCPGGRAALRASRTMPLKSGRIAAPTRPHEVFTR